MLKTSTLFLHMIVISLVRLHSIPLLTGNWGSVPAWSFDFDLDCVSDIEDPIGTHAFVSALQRNFPPGVPSHRGRELHPNSESFPWIDLYIR